MRRFDGTPRMQRRRFAIAPTGAISSRPRLATHRPNVAQPGSARSCTGNRCGLRTRAEYPRPQRNSGQEKMWAFAYLYIQLGDPRQIKVIQAGSIAPNNLRVFVLGHSGQDLRQNLLGLWERGLTMRIIGAPHHVVHANKVPQADADRILLEAQEHIAMEKVTGTPAIFESIDSFLMAFAVSVVHARE